MEEITFSLTEDYIEMLKLLKVTNVCSSGGEAKMLISEGLVRYNGSVDERKRLKVRVGDEVIFDESVRIKVIQG